MKYIHFRITQSHLGFSIDKTDHIIEIVSEFFPYGKFRKFDTTFCNESEYEKELMDGITIIVDFPGKF